MLHRYGWTVILVALLIPGVMIARASGDDRVDLSAAVEIWTDVLRDADALGTHIFRVSDADEMALGRSLTIMPGETPNSGESAYVQAVLAPLVEHVRRPGITYTAHVVDDPFVNAWALPGGQIYVTTGMLAFLRSEAELAGVLGHEIAHVDQRHCIDRYEYAIALRRAGLEDAGAALDLARRMASAGYSKYQEAEADAVGFRLTIDAGYDPQGIVDVMQRLAMREGRGVTPPASGIAEEIGTLTADTLGGYLASHPDPLERVKRLTARMRAERRRIAGHTFYVGVDNLMRRVARTRERNPNEVKTY